MVFTTSKLQFKHDIISTFLQPKSTSTTSPTVSNPLISLLSFPKMPTFGRGGAGNILSDADVKALNKSISHDLEASQHAAQEASSPSFSSLAAADAEAPDTSLSSRTEQQQYRTTGRGGAGNMAAAAESASLDSTMSRSTDNRTDPLAASDQQQPLPSTSPSSHAAEEANPSANAASSVPASHIPAYVGRGGAGNYLGEGGGTGIGMSGAKNAQEREVELQEMRVRRGVERAVEEGLSRPPVAHLGGGG
ncbi:MAG: hypothetical protein M1821_006946 [Bathelium mastoideum]|nr:MAG: hypothetical protein M1821_006946 [Bathelium mastoideum]